jgi:integrase/recombinase XerD
MEETRHLENAAQYWRDKLLVRLLARLGCRISEVLGITVSDIDFNQGTVTIQHLKTSIKVSCPKCQTRLSRAARFCPGCGVMVGGVTAQEREQRRQRTLPVDSDTLEMLRGYIKQGGPVKRGEKTLLFGVNRHRAWQIIKECAEDAGLPKLVNPDTGKLRNVSPHRLRDAFAVHAVKMDDSGDGLRLLQEHLGHQSISTTMKYRKISGEEHKDWYQKLWGKAEP